MPSDVSRKNPLPVSVLLGKYILKIATVDSKDEPAGQGSRSIGAWHGRLSNPVNSRNRTTGNKHQWGETRLNTYPEHPLRNKVLGVEGSPRKNGNSAVLLRHLLEGAGGRASGSISVSLRDHQFGSCIGCEKCRKDKLCTGRNDGMTVLYRHIVESKGLILVSPTHNYNVSAWTKAFIDRLYCFYEFGDGRPRTWTSRLAGSGRKAVIAAICEQEHKKDMGVTLEAMRWPLEALGYEIVEEISVFGVFDRGIIKKEAHILEQARHAGEKLKNAVQNG